jgi:hypothetical protein
VRSPLALIARPTDSAPRLALAPSTPEPEPPADFAALLRSLRVRHLGKHGTLSRAVGCTEAAVSYWERKQRLPGPGMLDRILAIFREHGSDPVVLDELSRRWWAEVYRRRDITKRE